MIASRVSGGLGPRTPAATLIMRVWWETSGERPFRARFAAVGRDGGTIALGVVTDPEAALATVRRWIEELEAMSGEDAVDST